jgi:hypothetical protein
MAADRPQIAAAQLKDLRRPAHFTCLFYAVNSRLMVRPLSAIFMLMDAPQGMIAAFYSGS